MSFAIVRPCLEHRSLLALVIAGTLAACSPREEAPRGSSAEPRAEAPARQQEKQQENQAAENPAPQNNAQPKQETTAATATPPGRDSRLPDFTALVKKQGPAVVNVVTSRSLSVGARGELPDDPFFEFFRRFIPGVPGREGGPREGMPPGPGDEGGPAAQGLGSGFIISKDGKVLTNAHVVAHADVVTVRLADGKQEFKGRVIGIDRRTDIALLKIDADDLPVATVADSAGVEPGQWVAAIGSPFGFANTITAGIVSATERALPNESFVPFIQTDVAVNPGNSGGPLLNLDGEVIGINSMIYSGTGGYMGVSFAIPIEVALDVARQLEQNGKVTRGRIGVGIQPVTADLAKALGLESDSGVVVTMVEPGGPAAKAGVQAGDVILQYAGKPIDDPAVLPRLVAGTKPGEQATLEVLRGGERRALKVTVGEFPEEGQRPARRPAAARPADRLGLSVSELPPEARKQLGVDYGVVVEQVQGAAASTPIRRGDVIVAINMNRFGSLEEFRQLLAKAKPGEPVALLVRRGEAAMYVAITVPEKASS